jgi:hypothetical protein
MSRLCLFAVVCLSVTVACKQLQLEHMYFDSQQRFDYSAALATASSKSNEAVLDDNGDIVTPVTAKAKCKGAACPVLHGTAVMLLQTAWGSINNRTCYIEETAGWFLLWADEAMSIPIVPHPSDVRSRFDSRERGYLAAKNAGYFSFR